MKNLLLKPIAVAAAACLLAACNTMAPRYERPTAPVAATFPAAAASAAAPSTGIAPAAQPWQAYFQDARLDQLIVAALANNRDLRVSVLNIEAALESIRLRFRPIIMTSLAFMLGVLPLAISSGAGSASQRAIGTGVMGGMATATLIGVVFVPLFFVLVRSFFKSSKRQQEFDKVHSRSFKD